MVATAEIRTFNQADEVHTFDRARFEIVTIGGGPVLRYVFEPGWCWSTDHAESEGTPLCPAPHTLYHVSGILHVKMEDGTEFDAGPGAVSVLPPNHDAWVVGNEPVVAIDFALVIDGAGSA